MLGGENSVGAAKGGLCGAACCLGLLAVLRPIKPKSSSAFGLARWTPDAEVKSTRFGLFDLFRILIKNANEQLMIQTRQNKVDQSVLNFFEQ